MTTGHDISKTRLDDLDRKIITHSLQEPFKKRVICNFGSGESKLSHALSALGHHVYSYDSRDVTAFFNQIQKLGLWSNFFCIRLQDLKQHQLPREIDIAVFQRVLHYLTYEEARKIISLIAENIAIGGWMYMSFSSIDTELGVGYTATETEVEKRWGTLTPDNQNKFFITDPVCLYSSTDVEHLIGSVPGLTLKHMSISGFGNIQATIRKQ